MAHRDIQQDELGELSWSAGERGESLSTVYRHTIEFAKGVEEWYAVKRSAKRPWGRGLRLGAILLAALAAVLPVISEIYGADRPAIPPGWATVALAAAAMLVALDRFFGFSSGWMRFMVTEQRVKELRHEFEFAWQKSRIERADPPSEEEALALLELARGFAAAVDEAVAEETGAWVAEFRSILEKTEQGIPQPERA